MRPQSQRLKAEHPFWGDRRSWAYLHVGEPLAVNKQRLLRLMRAHHLGGRPNLKRTAKRPPHKSNPRPTTPKARWGMDMTQVLGEGCGWGYVVLVLAWYTQKIVGYDAGTPDTSRHGLAALDLAVNQQFPEGARGTGLSLRRANGWPPTAIAFMKPCGVLGIQQAFTSDNPPRGNADTERVIRTLQEEGWWLQEWSSPCAVIRARDSWMARYNAHDLHSALGYKPPRPFEQGYQPSHSTPFTAA